MEKQFMGYKRPDGSVGVRNKLLVIATCDCSWQEAQHIASNVPGAVPITQWHGCGRDPMLERQFIGLAKNPNIGATLLVGHGCETLTVDVLQPEIEDVGKPVDSVVSQHNNGSLETVQKGTRILRDMARKISTKQREPFDLEKLTVAVECGGSDSTSGLAANPATGNACDRLIEEGGTAIFSEPIEMIGGENILAERAMNDKVAEDVYALIRRAERRAKARGGGPRKMSKGNIEGGLTTIEEKSLGAILKGGTTKVMGVLQNNREGMETPHRSGLYLQDGTGWDVASITHMLAVGAQVSIFTTGRGSTTGHALAPVIKVTGNPRTWTKMKVNMDINAGKIIEGKAGITDVGEEIFDKLVSVASGEMTKNEALGYDDFVLWRSSEAIEKVMELMKKGKRGKI